MQIEGLSFLKIKINKMANPSFIDSANVNYFGFNTTFNPYPKTVKFDISGITTFKTGGEANITSISFVVTDPNSNTYSPVVIDPSNGESDVTLSGLEQGVLYFGQYHIVATLTEPATSDEAEQNYVIEFNVNVCYDPKLNNKNIAVGCALIDVNCSTAKMVIKEGVNLKFAGKVLASMTTLGTVNYPIDPETSAPFLPPVTFTYTPYSLSLANAITGLYSIALITTAYYDLGNQCLLAIEYRSNVNKEVLCGNGMCEITCCWTESIDIIKKGGSKGSQMAELVAEAIPYYISAQLLADCGKNNDFYVKKVKEILNCDCKCESKSLLIQPNPITFGAANLIPSCGITIEEDENGDYVFGTTVYQIAPASDEDKISFETVQINACTKVTYATIHCDKIERCIYNILSSDPDILLQWQTLLNNTGCPCDDVTTTSTPQLLEVLTLTADFEKLDNANFVKNDVITGIKYEDGTQISGGTFSYTEIADQVIQQQGLITTIGQEVTLPCNVCGESLEGKSGKLITYVNSTCSCRKPHQCDIEIQNVPYSERYEEAYRFNPQINDSPYIIGMEVIRGITYTTTQLIYADSYVTGQNSSGSMIRMIKFLTDNTGTTFHETRTLFGDVKLGGGTITTYNAMAGDMVHLNKASSINLDHTEIVNGYPVMYFVTFGGAVCRAVRNSSANCDERKNWTVYVLKDLQSTPKRLYGMKKWYVDSNGNQTFLYLSATDSKVYLLSYNNSGGKNTGANWTVTDLSIPLSSVNGNINVDLSEDYIFLLGTNFIKIAIYSGSNTLADLQDSSNYSVVTCCSNPSATAISYIDGVGGTATIDNPNWIQKINKNSEDRYYFGNSSTNNGSNYQNWSYLRYFAFRGEDPAIPDSWVFDTEIVVNTVGDTPFTDGTWVADTSSQVNALSQGMCEIPDYGMVSLGLYGVRKFDMDTEDVEIVSGQAVANGDLVIIDPQMDTQFSYEISNCV
jgi:hypothetical protein